MSRNGSKRADAIHAALETLAEACRGRIASGEDVTGTVRIDDLDVEISLRVRRAVPSGEAADHRAAAMALLAAEGWRDHCPSQVKNRSYWSLSKTKSCDARVVAAVARRAYEIKGGRGAEVVRYEFCCHRHEEGRGAGRDVVAVVRLPAAELATVRAERTRRNEERRRLEDEEDRVRRESK